MLTIRTAESKIHWSKTGTGSKYVIEFDNGSVTVDSWINKGKKIVHLSIYNKDGHKLEDFKFNDQTEFQWFDPVNKLHGAIEKEYLESDYTADRILDELK